MFLVANPVLLIDDTYSSETVGKLNTTIQSLYNSLHGSGSLFEITKNYDAIKTEIVFSNVTVTYSSNTSESYAYLYYGIIGGRYSSNAFPEWVGSPYGEGTSTNSKSAITYTIQNATLKSNLLFNVNKYYPPKNANFRSNSSSGGDLTYEFEIDESNNGWGMY